MMKKTFMSPSSDPMVPFLIAFNRTTLSFGRRWTLTSLKEWNATEQLM